MASLIRRGQTAVVQIGDHVQLIHIRWTNAQPEIRVRVDAAPSVVIPLDSVRLQYRIAAQGERKCVGHKPFRDRSTPWVDCDRRPLDGSLTCDRCTAVDATFASQLHHAHTKGRSELDAAVLQHLDQPNVLYLAAFRDGSVKVGTSTKARLDTRLHEQGAWLARVVASSSDGFAVRSVEDRVSIEVGLPQSVTARRKLDGLASPKTDEWLATELDRWSTRVLELIAQSSDPRLTAASNPWKSAVSDDPVWADVHPYPLRLDRGAHDLQLETASGRLALAHRPDAVDRFVCDLRQIYGYVLELETVEADPLAVQDSLF